MRSLTVCTEGGGIAGLRKRYPQGLHFVVGDTHGEAETLKELMRKIAFCPDTDHAYFVGDYSGGGFTLALLEYLSTCYQADCEVPGFHLIRGNHERELDPLYPLPNLPDILVLRGGCLNYFIVHAGMENSAFRLIAGDMAENPEKKVFAYRLDESCTETGVPLRQIVWSRKGLYTQRPEGGIWPPTDELRKHRACIIHGHTPYCFLVGADLPYGDVSLFWEKEHIWFSEDLCSFNIDANIKGRYEAGGSWRGLACLCLEALEETALRNGSVLTADGILRGENGVFAVPFSPVSFMDVQEGDPALLLKARSDMKTITMDPAGRPVFLR